MDGVSVDFEFLGRFVLVYEEREYYHGPGLTKCTKEHRWYLPGSGSFLLVGLHQKARGVDPGTSKAFLNLFRKGAPSFAEQFLQPG